MDRRKKIPEPEKIPANVCGMIYQFKYLETEVYLRQWNDCFEYVFALHDKIYSDYKRIKDFNRLGDKKKNEVRDNLIAMLSSMATANIDHYMKEKVEEEIETEKQ